MTPPPISKGRARTPGWQSRDIVRATALVMGLYFAGRLFWMASPLFLTTFLGLLIGLAVSAGVDRLVRFRIPRGLGAGLIVATFIAALVGFGAAVAPTLRDQAGELRKKLPESIDRLEHWVESKKNSPLGFVINGVATKPDSAAPVAPIPAGTAPATSPAPTTDSTSLRGRIGTQVSHLSRYLFPFLTSTVTVVAGLLLIIFMSIYTAADPGLYRRGLLALFPYRHRPRVGEVLTAIAAVLRKWLVTQLIAMATIGGITTVVLLVLGVKAAFALGVIAGLLEFVPTVGPILSAVPAIGMAFLDSPEKALYVTIAYVGIQFIENHLLIPLLMKGGVNLPPALTIMAQALMALLFGFLGLMCAVPLLAAVTVAVRVIYVEGVIGEPGIEPDANLLTGFE